MKIRTGFVSNSSTASFIVRTIKENSYDEEDSFFVDKKNIKKLREFGFIDSSTTNPFSKREIFEEKDKKIVSLKYFISCNYQDVVCFLVENNIPFQASCHYDQIFMSYKKDSDYVFEAYNYGLEICMYREDIITRCSQNTRDLLPFKKIPKKEYLETNDPGEDKYYTKAKVDT